MPADPAALSAWLAALEARAPDVVAPFAVLAAGRPLELRRGIRARAGEGSAARILPQHAAIAEAYAAHLDALPDAAFGLPGGELEGLAAPARPSDTAPSSPAAARSSATFATPEAGRP